MNIGWWESREYWHESPSLGPKAVCVDQEKYNMAVLLET